MLVPSISHSILGTAHIVRGVGTGAVDEVQDIGGEAVHLLVDIHSISFFIFTYSLSFASVTTLTDYI